MVIFRDAVNTSLFSTALKDNHNTTVAVDLKFKHVLNDIKELQLFDKPIYYFIKFVF